MARLVRVDRGSWANNTAFIPGDYALDVPSSVIWNCAVLHTSAAAGTFTDDRTANPTYWRVELQVIASIDKTAYDGNLTPLMPNNVIRGRYPWRVPKMQEGGFKVSSDQKTQRTRWKTIRNKFKSVDQATRQRWYDARPTWHSLLWYYNYFMMSGLTGNAEIGGQGAGVIKDINHYTFTLPNGTVSPVTVTVDPVDPTKAVVFFFGAGWKEILSNFAIPVYPVLVSMHSTYLVVQGSLAVGEAAGCSLSLIEYI
jgi:hypothetical protein